MTRPGPCSAQHTTYTPTMPPTQGMHAAAAPGRPPCKVLMACAVNHGTSNFTSCEAINMADDSTSHPRAPAAWRHISRYSVATLTLEDAGHAAPAVESAGGFVINRQGSGKRAGPHVFRLECRGRSANARKPPLSTVFSAPLFDVAADPAQQDKEGPV